MKKPSALLLSAAFAGFVGVYEVAFAARYMAPIDLKPGTVAGFGVAIHDYNPDPKAKGGRNHATISTATREGKDLNEKPYLLPLDGPGRMKGPSPMRKPLFVRLLPQLSR